MILKYRLLLDTANWDFNISKLLFWLRLYWNEEIMIFFYVESKLSLSVLIVGSISFERSYHLPFC